MKRRRYNKKGMPPVRRQHPEHDAQVALFKWRELRAPKHPALGLLFACPNGMRTSMRTAVKAKAEGLRRGVPDVWLPVPTPNREYVGVVIEMKAPKGRTSPEQRAWMEMLTEHGWRCAVCYSAAEAIAVLCDYLGIAP
jgi:hypothetical protein